MSLQPPLSSLECLGAWEIELEGILIGIGLGPREEFMEVEVENLARFRYRHLRNRKRCR